MEEMFDVMAETPNGREKTPSEMTVEELRQAIHLRKKEEEAATHREKAYEAAEQVYGLYRGFLHAGFNHDQAFALVMKVMDGVHA